MRGFKFAESEEGWRTEFYCSRCVVWIVECKWSLLVAAIRRVNRGSNCLLYVFRLFWRSVGIQGKRKKNNGEGKND